MVLCAINRKDQNWSGIYYDCNTTVSTFTILNNISNITTPEYIITPDEKVKPLHRETIKTKCLTDENTELVAASDVIRFNFDENCDPDEALLNNSEEIFGEGKFAKELIAAFDTYRKLTNTEVVDYFNAGFLVNSETRKIIKPVVWDTL